MAEQSKRGSQLENGSEHGHGSKKARAQAMLIKQEQHEVGEVEDEVVEEEEEREEGEVSQGSGSGALVAVEAMETEPQINLRFGLSLFHCRACLLPLKPPTFKCEVGHVLCGTCCNSHGQVCGGGAIYSPSVEVDAFVRDAKQPCAHEEYGCKSSVVYFEAAGHRRACQWAPCSCPDPGCDFFTSPARLADHFVAAHSWPLTEVNYGKPHRIALPPPQGWHVLVGKDDGCVFLLSPCALGAAAAVSLVCVRANGDAAEGAPQFRCKLWAEDGSSKDNMTMMMAMVGSSSLSGGFSAADQSMFLVVPPEILHEMSGDSPFVMVRIDRAAAAAAKSTTPPVRSSRRRQ
ncbi:hypothetical protein BAE44_0012399 [Dichanthelium oligosanthes]|uniref:SIAH-type domain-containing protein n=1 Tax=Dichanthelium oligosanthes TaxID=888268 RepID=A0A1E5VNC6_9POAL|nr:hypothetical protein BAE44_0012399 [Dichanthelium oligosanthes]